MRHHYSTGQLANIACIWEAVARKPGNVHRSADFAGTTLDHFLLAGTALHDAFNGRLSHHVGVTVELATESMAQSVGQNTSLGIILAVAPLVATQRGLILRDHIGTTLSALSVDDATRVFRAIRLANPGGLGDAAEQDVRSEPTVTLLEAMKLAADRDLIARQYANNYADVFDLGVPAFLAAFELFGCIEAAVISCQLEWMAAFPDSLIARKCGPAAAYEVMSQAQNVIALGGLGTPDGRRAGVELDAYLRSDGNKLNPGTTADLVAACLFVALRENKVTPSAPFRWNVPDWL